MSTFQAYLGQVVIGTTTKDFSIDPGGGATALSLTQGTYYPRGYTGEATAQLVEHLQTVIRTVVAVNLSTVTLSLTTGKVTITFLAGGGPVITDIAWTDTALQTLLGFTGAQTGAASYTGSQPCKGTWLPSRALVDYPSALTAATWWGERSTSIAARGADGTSFSAAGSLLYDADLEYQLLDDSEVRKSSDTDWASLQCFWEQVVHAGKQIRVLPDRTSYTSTTYVTALWVGAENTVGAFPGLRHIANYDGFWDVRFRLVKVV